MSTQAYASRGLPSSFYQLIIEQHHPQPTLEQALSESMRDILIRTTGNTKLAQDPKIENIINNASAYIESYHYTEHEQENEAPKQLMVVKFNPQSIHKAIELIQEKRISSPKPPSLFWLIEQENHYLMDKDSYFASTIAKHAQHRMTPIVLPEGDHKDHELKKQYHPSELAEQLKQKYHLNNVVIGNISRQDEKFTIEWVHYDESNNAVHGKTQEPSLIQSLNDLVDQSLYVYAQQATRPTQTKHYYFLNVYFPANYKHLKNVQTLLHEQTHLEAVELQSLHKDHVELHIKSHENAQELMSRLNQFMQFRNYQPATKTMNFDWQDATNTTHTP